MYTKARRSAAVSVATLLTMAVSAAVWSQATGSATTAESAPATGSAATSRPSILTTTSRPGISQTATMSFNFENATIDRVLVEMSQRFGFIVIKTQTIPNLVTIRVPNPVHADEAVRLLNDALYQVGYTTLETHTGEAADAKTSLRLVGLAEAKKSNVPVFEGANPDDIPLSDNIITQVIPLKNVDATRLRSDLAPLLSSDADVTANSAANVIVITDTSAKIHRLVEIIQKMDNQRSIKTVIEYRQLINSSASDAARLINAMFNPSNTGTSGGGGGGFGGGGATGVAPGAGGRGGAAGGRGGFTGGGGGSGTAQQTARLYADSDARTNTVVLNGPSDQVAQAVDMLNRIESIPIDLLNTSVFFIKNLKNAQCLDIVPVLNQIFGGSTGTGVIGGTTGRGTTTTGRTGTGLTGTSGSGFGGGTTGRGTTGGGRTGGGYTDSESGAVAEAGGGGGGGGGGGRAGGGGGGGGGFGGGGGGGGFGTGGTNRGTTGTGAGGRAGTTNSAASALAGAAYFVANQDTNSILVTTDKTFEERVRNIIDELDRPVPQVLIKALVCEVTHTNGDDVGMEFGANNGLRASTDINGNSLVLGLLSGTNFGISNSGGGFKIGLVENQLQVTLRALANQNKLEVLSRPYILTQNNQEAYITIGQNVPYITNSQVTNTGQTINSVSYTQVGIMLDVLPNINPEGLVTMQVAPQVSQLDAGSGVPIASNVNAPTFTTRQAYANVAIKNGDTIVIGGLMQDQKQQIIQKIPILGDIPYLGLLFKRTQNTKVKTELLIFLTPHVAMTPDVMQKMSNEDVDDLKLVPSAVQPGTWEQQMKGMAAGTTTTQPQREVRLEGGKLAPEK